MKRNLEKLPEFVRVAIVPNYRRDIMIMGDIEPEMRRRTAPSLEEFSIFWKQLSTRLRPDIAKYFTSQSMRIYEALIGSLHFQLPSEELVFFHMWGRVCTESCFWKQDLSSPPEHTEERDQQKSPMPVLEPPLTPESKKTKKWEENAAQMLQMLKIQENIEEDSEDECEECEKYYGPDSDGRYTPEYYWIRDGSIRSVPEPPVYSKPLDIQLFMDEWNKELEDEGPPQEWMPNHSRRPFREEEEEWD